MAKSALIANQGLCCWIILAIVLVSQSRFSEGKPVRQNTLKPSDLTKCQNISRSLVNVVAETLSNLQQEFAEEFRCTFDNISVEDVTNKEVNTVTACLPKVYPENSVCQKMNRTALDETTCLKAIHADLKAFNKELQDLSPSLNDVMKELMKALKVQNKKDEDTKTSPCSTFECKYKKCGAMLAFRLRSVTIARVLNYLKEENTKDQNRKKQ
ncbi:interleukin-12 subunit alpha [Spea bombifrons]|uniref:interleukin-12 subunit alpha n=1 Tax=Spea bombifrons TaxID=233779 RepID=UPI00234A8F3B|nr:interleukin-12 subunit alpha [Spea bombifrons]